MKKLSLMLAVVALLASGIAAAASAVVTSLTGTAQVQSGSGVPRTLRQGDEVVQGDTVSTGAGSSVVLKFDDGQVAALTPNSRMQVSTYAYNPRERTGNILLSLVVGGMRAVTGLIGRAHPANVNFRASTATIGIRGTDGTIVTDGTNVVVTVTDGAMTFTYAGQTITIPAGQGAFGSGGQVTQGAAQQIFRSLPANFQQAIGNADNLAAAINAALPGTPRGDQPNPPGPTGPTPGTNVPPGGAGGGGISTR